MLAALVLALAPQPGLVGDPIEPPPAPVVEVRVENPHGYLLWVEVAGDAGSRELAELRDLPSLDLRLRAGHKYVLCAVAGPGKDERRLRLPLAVPERVALPDDYVVRVPVMAPESDAFAWIPAGPALVGDELGIGREHERPARIATLEEFWIGRREVTNSEYAAFLHARREALDESWIDLTSRKCGILRNEATGGFVTRAPDHPVVTVSWAGAAAYCDWLTSISGVEHRLPTELEWEKAARGPESFVYSYGNVFEQGRANQESGTLQAVGRHAPNGYGLQDMTGNAFEWTADVYRFDPKDAASVLASGDDEARAYRVLRGGSFVLDGVYLRNSFRMRLRPDVRTDDVGFRVVRASAPTPNREGKR